MKTIGWTLAGAAVLAIALPANAQIAPAPAPEAAPPAIDPSTIEMPNLAFTPTPEIVADYDKYYVFNRAGADFAAANADLQECDAYARGLAFHMAGGTVPYPYAGTMAGAIGGAIGSAVADAIFGSAERRKQRRMNMRTCMTYKGYRTFGLPKSIWETFNFEEGLSRVDEQRRQRLLQIQARVASGPMPTVGEIVE
jgi:hypothetical protein